MSWLGFVALLLLVGPTLRTAGDKPQQPVTGTTAATFVETDAQSALGHRSGVVA